MLRRWVAPLRFAISRAQFFRSPFHMLLFFRRFLWYGWYGLSLNDGLEEGNRRLNSRLMLVEREVWRRDMQQTRRERIVYLLSIFSMQL